MEGKMRRQRSALEDARNLLMRLRNKNPGKSKRTILKLFLAQMPEPMRRAILEMDNEMRNRGALH
jgi:hypothetical protein